MGYKIYKLSNDTAWDKPGPDNLWLKPAPTIQIEAGEQGWEEALSNWLMGKPPTNSPEWKKGVFAHTKQSQL